MTPAGLGLSSDIKSMNHRLHRFHRLKRRNLCNLWFHLFSFSVDAYRAFVERLANAPAPANTLNPYAGPGAAALRRDNLALYLTRLAVRRPGVLLVGEAPGYRGCGVTGVPFTSRAILLDEPSPFSLLGAAAGFRLGEKSCAAREASATIVWGTLTALGQLPLLWNACPFHPHPVGRPAANRAPTAAEVAAGEWAVRELLVLFPVGQVIAVGHKARAALGRWGIPAAAVRHPSHGGKNAFARELGRLFKKNGTTDYTDFTD